MSSALATVLAGVLMTGTSHASCVQDPAVNPTLLVCSGASTTTTTVTTNAISVITTEDTSISGVVPLSVISDQAINPNNMGGTFTATGDGVVLYAGTDIRQAQNTSIGATIDATANANGTALSLLAPAGDIAVTLRSSANLQGGAVGLLALAGGTIDVTATGGVFRGTSGDALTLLGGTGITANGFSGSAIGGQNGVTALATTGPVTINSFSGSAAGGQNGVFAFTSAGAVTIDGFSGSATGTAANGVFAAVTGTGDVSIQNLSGTVSGGQYGIFAQTGTGGNINLSGFAGTAQGTAADGVFAQTTTGNVVADNFTAPQGGTSPAITGGVNGLSLRTGTGDVSAKNFASSASGGQYGIFAQTTTQGNIDLSGFAGTAQGTAADGIFAQTLAGNVVADNFTAPQGGTGPAISGAVNGLSLRADTGTVSVKNFASSASGGQYGIFAQTTTQGNIDLSGFAGTAQGTAADGIFAQTTTGNVVADNFSAPQGGTGPAISGAVNGLSLRAGTGDVSAQNFASSTSGGQYGIFAQTTTSGSINLSGFAGTAQGTAADGIFAQTLAGNIIADNFTAPQGGTGLAVSGGVNGLFLRTETGDVSLQAFASSASGGQYGIFAQTVTSGGINLSGFSGTAQGTGASGIFAQTTTGNVVADNFTAPTGSTGPAISGAVNGLFLRADTGTVSVKNFASSASGGQYGIFAQTVTSGGVDLSGFSGSATGTDGTGIFAQATGGDLTATGFSGTAEGKGASGVGLSGSATGTLILATTGAAVISGTAEGIALNQKGGDVSVTLGGTTQVTGTNQYGLRVTSDAGSTGNVTIVTGADTAVTSGGTGILVNKSASAGGNVGITSNGTVTSTGGTAIQAILEGDARTLDITTVGKVTAGGAGIAVVADLIGAGGTLVVNNKGEIASTGTGSGIVANNTGGAATVTVDGKITLNTGALFGASVIAGGDATLNVNAAISGAYYGASASSDGSGTALVNVNADVDASGIGVRGMNSGTGAIAVNVLSDVAVRSDGIGIATSQTGTGPTSVVTQAGARIYGDRNKDGTGNAMYVFAGGTASVTIGTGNVVSGSGKSADEAVLRVNSGAGSTISVGSGALVSSWSYAVDGDLVTAAGDTVIRVDGGATGILNEGTIVGVVSLTANNDTFTNASSNTWVTVGTSNFGAGTDSLTNTGRTVTALVGSVGETTSLNSLETFINGDPALAGAGLLDMRDEVPGQIAFNGQRDVTYISGVFVGQGNSRVGVDAYLGGAGSTSDVLRIGGLDASGNPLPAGTVATAGQTALVINDVSNGPGGYNPRGMVVVDVVNPDAVSYGKGDRNNPASFVISSASAGYDSRYGGVIDKGTFFYDVVVRGNDTYLVGVPDQEVMELPKLVTAAQSIWHETTGVWRDRQADLRVYLGNPSTQPLVTKSGVVQADAMQASVTPGVWAKAVGSWGTRDATSTFTVPGKTYGYDTGYGQNTYGVLAGVDVGREGVVSSSDAMLFGVMGGYVTSNVSFNSPTSAGYSGGSVGVYATYLNQNWFLDGLFKADFLSMKYSAPSLGGAGYVGQSADVTNLGFTLDSGYRFKWGKRGFFEPVVSLSYVSTKIDALPMLAATVVDFGSNDSLRAGFGARVGGAMHDAATYWVEGSLVGRFWYEFLGNNTVAVLNPGLPLWVGDNFNGAFGEIGADLNIFSKTNGWNGFTNASVQFGDGYVAGSARGGMRYQW